MASTAGPGEARLPYALVALTPPVIGVANRLTAASDPVFSNFTKPRSSATGRIAVGDVLAITVFEAAAGGLFLPLDAGSRNGNFVQLPNVQVDGTGSITAPYSGTTRVVGKTPQDVGRDIAARIAKRAIEPQVVVSIVERHGNDVSVLGDVIQSIRFSLDPGGIKLLGALAKAQGTRSPPYSTVVSLQRGGTIEKAMLSSIVKSPAQNVELQTGDVVFVRFQPKFFLGLGATVSPGSVGGINNRRFVFEDDTMTLAEGLAKAGGLDDNRADPRQVFLYRLQSKLALQSQGVDTRQFAGDTVPTIYTVDLSRADGFFLLNRFEIRDRDILFVSNSEETSINKFLDLVGNVTGPVGQASAASVNLR